ncbi:nucleoside deaminase [Microbulbifer sp. EKSA008]|uniref:nucleoside deaminase n=1 Tax=Microbulbifer sp. EKSA008 TaxID=3243367 RepID=UPI004043870D
MALIGLLSIKKLNGYDKNTGLFRSLLFFALSQLSLVGIAKAESVKDEQDKILMLLAYSLVFQDWVRPTDKNKRGHNIGAVLFDSDAKRIVGVQLNSVIRCNDKTQHAEVRLMQQCLAEKCLGPKTKNFIHTTVTVYTSLEPCMMCSGMMIFLGGSRVVYGQADPDYGQSIERLQQAYSKNCGIKNSQCIVDKPGNYFTRRIISEPSKLIQKEKLDGAYFAYELQHEDSIIGFLLSDETKKIYKSSYLEFKSLDVRHKENQLIYHQALSILEQLENGELQLDYCPYWQLHHH